MPSLVLPKILLWVTLALAPVTETSSPQEPQVADKTGEGIPQKPNYESDIPPPSKFDLMENDVPSIEPRRDLLSQIARTVLALVVVLALIYLVSKYGLSRLTGLRTGASGQHLKVVERLQLAPKHTLYLIDVEGLGPLLLGGSDGDLRLLASLSSEAAPSHSIPFSATLSQSQSSLNATPSSGKASES